MSRLPGPVDAGLRLGLVTALATGMLALVFWGTKDEIRHQEQQAELRSLHQVLPANLYDNDIVDDAIWLEAPELLGPGRHKIYRGRLDGEPSAAAIRATAPQGYNGPIELLIGVQEDGTVTGVRVVSHRETPGLGDRIEIGVSDWITRFAGHSLGDPPVARWEVHKDGGIYDALTSATITSRAVVRGVRRALRFFQENKTAIFAPHPEPADE